MGPIYDTSDAEQLLKGMRAARSALARGEAVVIPTDTVYGIAVDAFDPAAVHLLLEAKGRGRESPPPVLVPGVNTLRALAAVVPDPVSDLLTRFWPGGLTVVLPAQPSLAWDLGDTFGTVAVRMPADRIALELLEEVGPLAVSSANKTGMPAATTATEAEAMLGSAVAVYLDGGPSQTGVSSTIIDATALAAGREGARITVLREGAVTLDELEETLGDAFERPGT